MKINKICSKLIKPLTPTPPNLKNYEISFWDSRQIASNIAVVLFYESQPESDRHLEDTLAETLVQFYPLAGRFIKKHNSVDCSDQGAEFLLAEALDFDLASVIGAYQHHQYLIPDHFFQIDESDNQPLLSIQSTRFACGGMALSVSVSHRVFDASSLATFVAAWSSAAGPGETIITPLFNLPSFLPMRIHNSVATVAAKTFKENVAVKKLHFDKATIMSLKSKIGKPVSAARAVSAVTAKALILLDGAKHGGICRGFYVIQAVNMRERTTQPVGKHACGNFSFLSLSRRVDASEAEGISIPELSDLIGEAVRRCIVEHAEVVSGSGDRDGRDIIIHNRNKIVGALREPDMNVIIITDWSKFGFYDVDFGCGKAASWASPVAQQPPKNWIKLLSTKEGDGVEAWLRLNPSDSDVHCFHQDCEFINQQILRLCK